jgi:Zn-dependent metalloprotease
MRTGRRGKRRGTKRSTAVWRARLRAELAYVAAGIGAAVAAIGASLVALSAIALALGASGAGGLAMSGHPLHVALEDGAVAFYMTQLVSLSLFQHTAALRVAVLPGLALVAVAIAPATMVTARLIAGSVRRRMLLAALMPIPYALLAGLGAHYMSLRISGPFVGSGSTVQPAAGEAFLLPFVWALLFAPMGALVGVFGKGWRREGARLLGVWATPMRASLRAIAIGLALTCAAVLIGGAMLAERSGAEASLLGGGFGHIAAVLAGALMVLPTLVVSVFLACFGVSFHWHLDALAHTQGSGSIFGGTLPTIGAQAHHVPGALGLLLLLGVGTVVSLGWVSARRGAGDARAGLAGALRAGVLMTLICWLLALVGRVDAQAGGYLGAHFQVDVASLLWHVPLGCLLGSLAGCASFLATRGELSRRELIATLLDLLRPSRALRAHPVRLGSVRREGMTSRTAVALGAVSLPAMLVAIGSAGAGATTAPPAASFSLAPIAHAAEQRLRTVAEPGSRLSVSVDPGTRVLDAANVRIPLAALGVSSGESPAAKAQAVLGRYGSLFGIPGRGGELGAPRVVTEPITKTENLGMTHVYFQQMADGVPVFGGSIGVHLARDRMHVDFVSGAFIPEVTVADDKVAVDSSSAVALAKAAMPDGKLLHRPRLEVYAGAPSHVLGATARLAWFVWLTSGPLQPAREYVIDAVDGTILNVFNKSFNAANVEIYSAKHEAVLPGTKEWKTGETPSEDKDTKEAGEDLTDAAAFFELEILKPRCVGTNCKGASAVATVHYRENYKQAEWNPEHQEVVFGDGYPAALDIAGHEYAGGLAENVTHEMDEGETGALKEGWADAMGKGLEAWVNRTESTWAEPNWKVGWNEPGGAIRNLKEPGEFEEISGHKDPAKLSEYVTVCKDSDGIHENSTIISHAFYLLATKIGVKEATQVFYRTQIEYLTNERMAKFEQAREDAIAAAQNIELGSGGAREKQIAKATETAFNEVGLNGTAVPPAFNCASESECSAARAIADEEPNDGVASAVSMLTTLYRARGVLAQPSVAGRYYMPLYEQNMGRITELVARDPTLEQLTISGLKQITPALNALIEGEGQKYKLTPAVMAEIEAALGRLAQDDRMYSGGGPLAKLIERELRWLRLRTYAGMTYAAGFERLNRLVKPLSEKAPPPVTTVVDPECQKPYTNEFQVYAFNVDTPGHDKPGEASPIDSTGLACGTSVEKTGEATTCHGESTLNTKLTLELPPGDKVRPTSELSNGSWIGRLSGRVIGCAGDESRAVFGVTDIKSLKTWTSAQCPTAAISCYEGSGSFEASEGTATGHAYAWVKEETSKRLVLTLGALEVEAKGGEKEFKVPTGFTRFQVEMCALAGEPGTEGCGTSPSSWVHKNGEESRPGCPTENGRYLIKVTNAAGKVAPQEESCVYWGEELHKQTVDSGNSINALSCVPATTDCALTDSKGNAYYSTNVSATAASTWTSWTGPTSPGEAIACPASTLCTLADGKASEGGGGNIYYATSLGGSWSEAFKATSGVLALSCPSSSFCVGGEEKGEIRYSTKPASTSWTGLTIGTDAIDGVYCLSSSFCAVVNNAGELYVAATEAKVKEAGGWKATDIDGTTALHGVSCTSTKACVAVDASGNVIDLAINASGEATATKQDVDAGNDLTAISCAEGLTCAAVDSKGNVLVSSGGGKTWSDQHALGKDLTSVACPSERLCVTADTEGNVTAFTPIGVAPIDTQTIDSSNSVNAVSCVPETTDCAVSDSQGNALYATGVSVTAPATWTSWSGPASPSEALACPSSSLCVLADGKAGEGGGDVYYATSLGGAWKEAFSPSYGVDALSCASTSLCVDGQNGLGYIRYTTNPGSSEWTFISIGSGEMTAVDCLTTSFCAVVDNSGHVHIANTAAHIKEAAGWVSTDVDGSTALHGVACTSTTSCIAVDASGNVLDLAINSSGEATVAKEDLDATNDLTAISCRGAACVAVDSVGNVFVTINAGSSWKDEHALGVDLTSVSCATSILCLAADTTGHVTAFAAE